ncbi:MAG: YceI family protein [Hyphomonas sp.]
MTAPFRILTAGAAALAVATGLSSCATPAPAEVAPAYTAVEPASVGPDPALANGAPTGHYRLDPHHASLVFAVDHLGFSSYVGQFTRFDAALVIDPADPEAAELVATIDVSSLMVPAPPEGFLADLLGPQWFNAEVFPEIRFTSTAIVLTSPSTADVTGNLEFLGAVLPVTFDVVFNGAYPGFAPYDPNARAGFRAEGSLSRSAFGMAYGLPPEGTRMGVGDKVKFRIDAEFTGPALEAPAADPAP